MRLAIARRKTTSKDIESQVIRRCRRRCCICYGLNKDDNIKPGQIAHLDKNPSNNAIENLAFLCLEHHNLYDSRTSQSKNLTLDEVKAYRDELESKFSAWGLESGQLLNFLADYINIEMMADAAEKIAAQCVWHSRELALEALTQSEVQYSDMDLYFPLLVTLDAYQSWGWLTYTAEELSGEDKNKLMDIKVQHRPVCSEVARVISDRVKRTNTNEK